MRIWLDPNKLNKYDLTPQDITQTVQVQNNQVASGQLGGAPAVEGQQLNANIIAQTRLQSTEQFQNILLKVNPDGSQVFLRDVARVELAAQNYDVVGRYNGQPAAGLAISLASGANALDTADAVRARLEELKPFFPDKMEMDYPYDTTPFVEISIEEVVHTLFEAIVLVFLVMYLFLQNFRATLIPTIAVPVVLLGTFGVLAAFGFSINTLTMFGMVLAIGLLVDDAIVVVENVERVMHEEGLPPRKPPANQWARSPAPWWVLPWYCQRYLSPWRSSRLHRGDLPAVLDHHCVRHGAVRAGCPDPHPRPVCHHAQGQGCRAPDQQGFLRLV